MSDSSGDKLCPICDSPLQPGSKKCGFCGTDLSIFDIETETGRSTSEPAPSQPKASLENKIEEILRPRPVEVTTTPPPAPSPPAVKRAEPPKPEPPRPEPRKEGRTISEVVESKRLPEPPKPAPPVVAEEPKEYFECPQCGSAVENTASSCPKCGVLFTEEGADSFECPACSTLVPLDAKTCPGCGAVFVEEEEAAAAPPPATQKPPEKPVAEVRIPPAKAETKAAVKEEEEAAEKGKGFMGLFKRKKEPEPTPPHAKPAPSPAAPAPKAPAPAGRPAEAQVVREVAPAPAPRPSVRPAAAEAPGGRDKGKDLARMVAEMKPLLAVAREKDVDIGESKLLIDEAAVAGRERQLDKAIELVDKSRLVLMGKIDAQLGQLVLQLNEETKAAREFGGDISRATTYMQELARARSSGDVEAAYIYVDKVQKELLPITGRYNESKKKISSLKQFIANCEVFIVDTKDARKLLVDSAKAFDQKDFDKVDTLTKQANDSLNKAIPLRMNDEMKKAKDELLDAKVKNVNITPMLTVLKSATNLMKSGDYPQAIKEMREFKEMMNKVA
ncbi:MAG: hypothetical protein A3K76_01900 [Euryarchaeota archaeon RBG_13_57_23]|nr:MAG: hypothetical protein A3K76_01900 [Euryarchaeota archaeon RBG_13_57_23]